MRRVLTTAAIVLGCLLLLLGSVAGVVNRQVLDGPRFAQHVDAVRVDPAVTRQLGQAITTRDFDVTLARLGSGTFAERAARSAHQVGPLHEPRRCPHCPVGWNAGWSNTRSCWSTTGSAGFRSLVSDARSVNARGVLLPELRRCERDRGHLPNFVAVNYYDQGDLFSVIDEVNGTRGLDRTE